MPSSIFKEAKPKRLEPAQSFRERLHISEVESDLRAYFSWNKAESLPKWLDLKLKGYPHIRKHAFGFLHYLQNTESVIDGKSRSLYDILMDCIITDLLMTALQHFEAQYRWNEYADKFLRTKESAVPTVKPDSYLRWIFPDISTKKIKFSNLKRYPLSRYYYADNGSLLPRTLDQEFLQVITIMHSHYVQTPDQRYILRPLNFLPLMDGHPYFTYSLEKYFGCYQMLSPRNTHSIVLSSQLFPCVQAYYGYNQKLVQKCEKAKEIPPVYIEPPLSAVFPNRPMLKIPAASFFRSSVNLLTRRTWSADCLSA
ncbi:hypothetical protein [Agathobaculum sp.]|uniref:hypothetical protein n=1 Tax=Agathobaculum sp. TaxID=2048138 RepID=UPI003AEFA03A